MSDRVERITPAYRGVMIASSLGVVWWGAVGGITIKFAEIGPPQGWKQVRDYFAGANLKILLRLVVFFLFVAPFYALYDQSGGAWVNQAGHLDLRLHFLGITLLQDQVQSANAILILVFIPLFLVSLLVI